ncbi:MAG: ABC transporter permease [Faecousia sp.]
MRNGLLTIFKKELARFFSDKRMVFSTVLLPGLIIYLLYSLMGSAIMNNFSADETQPPLVAVFGSSDAIEPILSQSVRLADFAAKEDAMDAVSAQTLDALVVFPEGFDAAVSAYEIGSSAAPNVAIYYNSTASDSQAAYLLLDELFSGYEATLCNKFDVNAGGVGYDLASDTDETSSFFSMMLPMLLMIFLFSGCMAVAPEAIAGEKERGTIATLLITPVSRSQIALGKIMALSVIALLSAASSAIGTILSLPKLMGGAGSISGSLYSTGDYLLLAAVIASTVLLLVALISIVSAFAKTMKEAQTFVMPLMLVVMFLGITAMFGNGASTNSAVYLIPLYNSVQSMVSILTFDISALHLLLTVGSNLVYALLGTLVLTRMFQSERIIFSK